MSSKSSHSNCIVVTLCFIQFIFLVHVLTLLYLLGCHSMFYSVYISCTCIDTIVSSWSIHGISANK